MGGAVGHLMHVYDDPNLTFGQIKEILTSASEGRLEKVTEKLDGRNIVFTWNVPTNELKVARASGDITRGGMNATELAQKFQGRENLEEAFNSAFEILRSGISTLNKEQQILIFGKNSNKWYSAEIIYAASPNVIQYDKNSIIFHGYPIFEVKADGTIARTSDDSGIDLLISNIENMQRSIKSKDWAIHGPAIVSMKKVSDGSILETALTALAKEMSSVSISDSNTVQEFIERKVKLELEEMGLSGSLLDAVAARVLKKSGSQDLRKLKKNFPMAANLIDNIVKKDEKIVRNSLIQLDEIINSFAIKILESLKSSFISNNEKEVERLRQATNEAITAIKNNGDAAAIEFLDKQLKRMGSTKNIKSAVEGIVFSYGGKVYKFTGAFAAANQILGFYRYKEPKKLEEKYLRNIIRLMLF